MDCNVHMKEHVVLPYFHICVEVHVSILFLSISIPIQYCNTDISTILS